MTGKFKRMLLLYLPYVLIALLSTKLGEAWRSSPGLDISQKVLHLTGGFAFQSPWPSLLLQDLILGIGIAACIKLAVYVKGRNAKKYRKNIEYGSARWGRSEDIKPFVDPVFQNNVILTETERLTMNNRPKDPRLARNKNVMVVGGSGSGKTRFWLKPNLMQCHSSYVVTDPKGSVVVKCGNLLLREGYKIKILNTINFSKSMRYNPFAYIHSEKDILKLVTALIANTKGEGKAGDDFWVKAETLLYTALMGYIHYESPESERNFSTLIELINASEVREDNEDFQNPVDLMFAALEERDSEHFAVRQYKKYKLAAGKTAKSILISCGARLSPFDIKELRDLTAYDEMELDALGDRKTALFIIISDTFNTGESRGREVSHSLNYQKLRKEFMSIDELAVLDGGKCILQLRGVRPFLSSKYDITKHPNYKYLSDADPRNAFSIEKYLYTRLKPKPDEIYDVYHVDMYNEPEAAK